MTSTPLQPGDSIPLTDDQREALGRQALDILTDLERKHARRIADIGIHWDWYAAKPDVPVRTEPWARSSNVVVPFIRQQSDSLIARHLLQIFSTPDVWSATTEDEFFRPRLQPVLDFHNHSARRPFDLFDPIETGTTEFIVIGQVVWAQRWHRRARFLVPPGRRRPVEVLTGESVELYHRPAEQWLWMEGVPIADSPVVVEQSFTSESELIRMGQVGAERHRWNRPAIESVLGQTGIEGPVEDVRRKKLRQMNLDPSAFAQALEPHDIRQVWLDWPFFASLSNMSTVPSISHILTQEVDQVSVPVCVTLHRRTGTVLRAIYSPYLLDGWPFYEANYRKISGPGNVSHGVAKMGEHVQRALSTIVNQTIDAVTFGNSLKMVTSDKNLANRTFRPNTIPHVTDVNAVKELSGQKSVFPDIAVANMLQAIGERTIGQGDPNLGREVRMGGHPQPATNFMGLIQQSQILSTRSMKALRRALTRAGEDRSIMFQQFERNEGDWIPRVFGPRDALAIQEWLNSERPAPGHVRFDIHGLSEIHNPDAERQKAVLVDQMTTNYFVQVAQFLDAISKPQTPPPVKKALTKAIEAKTKSMTRFLEASDVDEIESYVLALQDLNGGNLGAARTFADQLRERAGAAGNGAAGPPQAADGSAGPLEGSLRGGGLEALQGGGSNGGG